MSDGFRNGNEDDLPMGKAAVNKLIRENSHIFTDTSCKVCSAALNSESQKLAHYQSKKHANKYRRYLSIQQGEDVSPAKKMKSDDPLVATGDTDRNKYCPVCNMSFSSPVVAMSHYEGRTHSKHLKLQTQGVLDDSSPAKKAATGLVPEGTPKTVGVDQSDPNQFCNLCNATFNNPHMAEQHYMGKKHKKQETKSKLMTIYTSSGNPLPQTTPLKPLKPGTESTGNGFTCDICNIVVNSIEQYQAHITGSKHKNNLMAMVTTSAEQAPISSDRKSFAPSSSRLLPSETPYSSFNFSSSVGELPSSNYFSSSPSSFSSLGTTSSSSFVPASSGRYSSGGGLLPRPSYSSQSYQSYGSREKMYSDHYNSLNQGY